MCHAASHPVVPAFLSNFMHFGKVLKKKYPNFTFSYRVLRHCPIRIARRNRYASHWAPCCPTEAIAMIHERHAMGEKEVSSGSTRMPSRRSDSAHLPGYLLDNEQKAGRRMPTIRAERPRSSAPATEARPEHVVPRGLMHRTLRLIEATLRIFARAARSAEKVPSAPVELNAPAAARHFVPMLRLRVRTGAWQNPEWTQSNLG